MIIRNIVGGSLAALCLLAGHANAAILANYDAGTTPATATSPDSQGWISAGISTPNDATGTAVNDDLGTGLNAWKIKDGSNSDRPRYTVNLSGSSIADMGANGWELTAKGRAIGSTINIVWGVSDDSAFGGTGVARRWGMGMRIDGNGDLFVQWFGGAAQKITTDGSGASAYHDLKLVGTAGSTSAELFIDNVSVGSNNGQAHSGTQNKIEVGSTSTSGIGNEVNWHSIRLQSIPVPEPASLSLIGLGTGLLLLRRK
ncbi:PEP-CTERM sorting domain-containing protein [Poriferisphaera sp. WC338]|uniref:PEP-CTERM sorting domain-containing protein n=1 Tax=Poriferisphaera sp. WC338 TaxID=3425129 RepID=UPI003D81B9D4